MENNGWKKLSAAQLGHLQVPSSRTMALVDAQGKELLIVGVLLLEGDDNCWLVDPVRGYPQWVCGHPADHGDVPDEMREGIFDFTPLEERLPVAEKLLARYTAKTLSGDYQTFRRCAICGSFRIQEVWIDSKAAVPEPGVYYLTLRQSRGLVCYLRPDGGICTH